jgi:hypothetical protein
MRSNLKFVTVFAFLTLVTGLLTLDNIQAQIVEAGKNITNNITNTTLNKSGSGNASSSANVTTAAGNNGHIYRGGAAAGSGGE